MANSASRTKSEEQIHYEHLSSFLKWAISIAGTIIATVAAFAIYISYSDRNAMTDEYTKAISNLQNQIKDLKAEANAKNQEIHDYAKEAVQFNLEYSEREISRVKEASYETAIAETKKEVEGIFASDKIQNIIQNQAVKEIRGKVGEIVAEETKNINKINDAANRMRIGMRQGMIELQGYFKRPDNPDDSLRAKELFDRICKDYLDVKTRQLKYFEYPIQSISLKKGQTELTEREKLVLKTTIDEINTLEDLDEVALRIVGLSKAVNEDFKPFEFDRINAWYNGLKK